MRYLSIAFLAEGPTDVRFFEEIAVRLTYDLVITHSDNNVEVQQPCVWLDSGRLRDNQTRVNLICRARSTHDLFVLHADASHTAYQRIDETIVATVRAGTAATCALEEWRIIALIPAREMEAWALADPSAIARALGYENGWPQRLPLDYEPHNVESIVDPKSMLEQVVTSLQPGRRSRRRISGASLLSIIAEFSDLRALRRLPSFRVFEGEIRNGLIGLGIIAA